MGKKARDERLLPGAHWVSDLYSTLSADSSVYVVGFSGSLRYFPWHVLDGCVVVGVNDMIKHYPIDYHYFSDTGLFSRYKKVKVSSRTKAIVCQHQAVGGFQRGGFGALNKLYQAQHSTKPTDRKAKHLFVRRTVACGGVELAWKLGAQTIYMLGIDGCRPPAAYYADGSRSRWKRVNEPKGGVSVLRVRAKRCPCAGTLEVPIKRIMEYGLQIEDRHLDWYEDFCALKKFHSKLSDAPRIVNLSPLSIFDQFEIEDPYKHFDIKPHEWRLT